MPLCKSANWEPVVNLAGRYFRELRGHFLCPFRGLVELCRGIICILQLTFFRFFKYRVYLCSVKEMEVLLCWNRSAHKINKYVCQRIYVKFCYISKFQEKIIRQMYCMFWVHSREAWPSKQKDSRAKICTFTSILLSPIYRLIQT